MTVSCVQVCQEFAPRVQGDGVDEPDEDGYARTLKDALLQAAEDAGGKRHVLADGAISDEIK